VAAEYSAPTVTDVVIPIYAQLAWARACIESVLAHSGPALGRVFLVNDCGPEQGMLPLLRELRLRDPRIRLLENERRIETRCHNGCTPLVGFTPSNVDPLPEATFSATSE
jgi:hypothetical protein